MLTSKRASCNNGVHLLQLNRQKCSEHRVLGTFWLRHVLCATSAYTFRELNFQKCSKNEVLLAFWFQHVLHATAVCKFWSLSSPDVPAALATLPFHPPESQNIGSTFSRTLILFFLTLSLLWSYFFFFSSLLFSDSSHLWLSSVHTVGSLTSKLPSEMCIYIYIHIHVYMYIYIYICIFILCVCVSGKKTKLQFSCMFFSNPICWLQRSLHPPRPSTCCTNVKSFSLTSSS